MRKRWRPKTVSRQQTAPQSLLCVDSSKEDVGVGLAPALTPRVLYPAPWVSLSRCCCPRKAGFAALSAVWHLTAAVCYAAPPALEMAPAFGDAYFPRSWQTVVLTATNPDNGDAFQGDAQIVVEDVNQRTRFGAFSRSFALPKGAGTARIPITIRLPQFVGQMQLHLYLFNAPDKGGAIVTERTIDRLSLAPTGLPLIAVTPTPDGLTYLNGADLGAASVINEGGTSARSSSTNGKAEQSARVIPVRDAAELPDRAAGYDPAALVFLSADVSPNAFSDAQTAALRGFVSAGGLLTVCSGKLRGDERFRSWIPALPDGQNQNRRRIGRGIILALAFDPSEPGYRNASSVVPLLKSASVERGATRSIGRIAVSDDFYRYQNFASATLHVPGLSAPGVGYIGLFLGAYILLLIPVNYLILRRLDRRELAWITIPALAAFFAIGALSFSYAVKGRQLRMNVATIIEMGEGSGDALTHAMIGLFSPTRAHYSVTTDAPDAVFWSPRLSYSGMNDASVIVSEERESGGTLARDVAVPMWGMSVVGARASGVRFGDGVTVNANRRGDILSGSVINHLGRRLENVVVRFGANGRAIGTLNADQTLSFSFHTGRQDRLPREAGLESPPAVGDNQTVEETLARRQIAADISASALEGMDWNAANPNSGRPSPPNPAPQGILVSGWSYEKTLPLQVDGRSVTNGENVSLFLISAPRH